MIAPSSKTPRVSPCKPLCAILLAKASVYPLSPVKTNVRRLCECDSRTALERAFPLPYGTHIQRISGRLGGYRRILSTYQCWPSYTTIGNAVGRAKNTVMRYVDALAEKGLIYTEPTSVLMRSGIKKNGTVPCLSIRCQL